MTDLDFAWLRAQQGPMEAQLRALVETSSHTADKPGVDAAGRRLTDVIPLSCRRVESARFGDHLFFDAGGGASQGGVVLVGHHDTVFPREVFSGYVEDGEVARGPGVLDMKGGLVVIAFALQQLERWGLLARVPLTLAVVADEEVGSPESAAHLREAARGASAGLVFEAGRVGDAIITQRKGTLAAVATATGRAAHAGNAHHEGANAIWAMARFIDRAQSLTDHPRGVTVNVGRVQGGVSKNTVPDRCDAWLDGRFVAVDDGAWLTAQLRDAAAGAAVDGATVALDGGVARNPLVRTVESAALRDAYGAAQHASGLGDRESDRVGGGSDASTLADVGVPAIDGLGPRGRGFHTLDEQVERASLVPKAEALVRFLAGRAR